MPIPTRLQGGNVGIRLSDNVGFRFRLRHSNNFTGVPSDWWFNGNPVLPPDSDQWAHQNNFLASAALTITGPGAWQHQITGFEYNHLGTNTDTIDDPGRPYDSPFYNDASYNRAGFSYQGTWAPRSWALTTIGDTFEDENGNIVSTTPAPDATYSFTHGLRINNYLFAQENIVWKRDHSTGRTGVGTQCQLRQPRGAARFGIGAGVERQSHAQRHAAARRLRARYQGAQLRAVVRQWRNLSHAAQSRTSSLKKTTLSKLDSTSHCSATSSR